MAETEKKNKNKKKKKARKTPPTWGFKLFTFFMRPYFKLVYNPKIIGGENIPAEGPIIIAGNHIHILDQCHAINSTKRAINFMAKREYFEGKMTWFFKFTGCIPVNRTGTDLEAIKAGLSVLKKGGAIGIFPEGTRNKTDAFIQPFKAGAVAMAKKTGAYIVPFGITGDYKFRSKNLVARFGEPFKVGDMTIEEANDKLFNTVKSLMEENLKEQNAQ